MYKHCFLHVRVGVLLLCLSQAYNVARMMFDVANKLSESQDDISLLSMVYPSDCHPDDNPAFIICRSDTCSFTWTGEEHIHQVKLLQPAILLCIK